MYFFWIELPCSFGHHFGNDFFKHLDVAISVVPKSSNHFDFLVFSKEVFKILDKDFDDFGLVVGYFLLI